MISEQQISEEKYSFLTKIKDSFSSHLTVLLMAGTLALSSCQNNSSTPEEVYQGWVQSLKSGNLEESLKYISPSSQNLQKALAGTINLPLEVQGFGYGQSLSQIGNQLGDNNLTFKEEFGNYRDYSFACQDTSGQSWECLIRFLKDENGKWKIYGF